MKEIFKNKKARTLVLSILFFVIIAVRLGVLYHQRALFVDYDRGKTWNIVLSSLALFTIGQVIASCVWADIMKQLGSKVALSTHIHYYCISRLSFRIPGKIWFLASRGYLYKQDGDSFRLVTVASGVEYSITIISGILVSLFTISYTILDFVNPLYYGIAIPFILLIVLSIHPRTITWIMKRTKLEYIPDLRYTSLLRWFGGYIILWLLSGLMLYLNANIVTNVPHYHLGHVIGSWCLISVIALLAMVIPTSLGLNDIGLSLLLMPILPGTLAPVVAVLFNLLALLYEVISLGIVMAGGWLREKLRERRLV